MEVVGLNKENIKKISKIKQEDEWVLDFRLKSYDIFNSLDMPNFGPKFDLDFNKVIYYKSRGKGMNTNWNTIDEGIKCEFQSLGVIDSEKYLDGIGVQYESEVIYHNMIEELTKKNVIFTSIEMAMKEYPDLVKKYFSKIVKSSDNKLAALNGAVFSGGSFIYIPPNTTLDRPLQSYFRINSRGMGQFERTLIIVDDNSHLHYVEGCTAPTYTDSSLHMEWIDGNIGSLVTMKYPACILKGDNSTGTCITISVATHDQQQDSGARMIHIGKNTTSTIISKSIARLGGNATYRGKVEIKESAVNSKSIVKCDSLILDKNSKSDAYPTNICKTPLSSLEHEATVSRISEDKLFYLESRGIDEEKATELIKRNL